MAKHSNISRSLLRYTPALLVLVLSTVVYGQQRVLEPADLGRLEQLGDRYSTFTVSPDRELLAFVVQRAQSASVEGVAKATLIEERNDVWLTSLTTFKTWNLTNGAKTSTGFSMPVWSPNGKYLAMISSGNGSERIVVWDKQEGKIRELLGQSLNYWFSNEPSMVWLSEDSLICSLRPKGRRPRAIENLRLSSEIAIREWQRLWRGEGPTASVIDSGVAANAKEDSPGELTRINVRTGKVETLASGHFRNLQVSPDRKHLAYMRLTQRFRPDAARPLTSRSYRRFAAFGYRLEVMNDAGELVTPKSLPFMNVDLLVWDHSGQRLSLVAEDPRTLEGTLWTYVFNIQSKEIRKLDGQSVEDSRPIWLGENVAVQATDQSSRYDWWLTGTNSAPKNLTSQLPSTPGGIIGFPDRFAVTVSNGELWRIAIDGSNPAKINTDLTGIKSIIWPVGPANVATAKSRLIVETKDQANSRFYLMDVVSGRKEEFPVPEKGIRIVGFDEQRTAIMSASTRTGTYLWLSEAGQPTARRVFETNQFLGDIAEGQRQQFEYKTIDRQLMKAWIVLPPSYQKGKLYPVVTWVYPGVILGDSTFWSTNNNDAHPLNLQLLAAHGYVVLIPSIPLKPPGQISDTYIELTNGVLPAVDKLVELGIADPDRIAVAGQSWGGYATLSLITQTRRFRTSVALAGPSDYLSLYGEFGFPNRYTNDPLVFPRSMFDLEGLTSLNMRLGSPPWKDLGLYLRNNPMFFIERVETPVMLIQGDSDTAVPVEQGEQFFSGLYRQGKRARFVRYWGEPHIILSHENVKDMWGRIYEWLDEFLKPNPESR